MVTGVFLTLCFSSLVQAESVLNTATFDHTKTGFLLRDAHTTLMCEQCHVDGIFKNTPKDCAGCHSIGSRIGATPKPVNHVQTTNACDTCHSSPSSFLVRSFNHAGITSGCTSCHNSQSYGVLSKPTNHFPTLLPCESCHTNTNTFLSWKMDHTGLTTNCVSCHGGQYVGVVGKPTAHVPTTAACETCHSSTITFLGALYNHALASPPVAGRCSTCHLGQLAGVMSQPSAHIPTYGTQCDSCHTAANTGGYTSFLGGNYGHATPSPTSICSSCHTGQFANVQGKPTYHIATSAQCDTCHTSTNTSSYTTFFGATYTHGTITAACSTCHNGVSATGKNAGHLATSADCGSCHTSANTSSYTTFLGATYTHSPNPPTAGSCPTCHNGTTAVGKPSTHMVTTLSCEACHTQTNTSNYTTFLGASTVDHSTIAAGTCASCHNGTSAKGLSTGHIPTGTMSCDGCHAVYNGTTVLTFAGGTINHVLTSATRCDACHNGSYSTQGTSGAQPVVSTHIPLTITSGLDCNTCHKITVATTITSMSWVTETMNHNGAKGGGSPIYCVTCHLSGVTYMGSAQKVSHNGASTSKDCSNSSCHAPLGGKGKAYSSWN